MYQHSLSAVNTYIAANPNGRSAVGFKAFCDSSSTFSDVFVCDGYRLCRAAKLLMSLGYGNFVTVIQYDIYSMAEKFISDGSSWSTSGFSESDYALQFTTYESPDILNSPNLSLFPLLAYHKICNDHYRNEKWQSFQPWTCNIDYVNPSDNMNAKSFVNITTFTWLMSSIIDLENANLPIDYFTSVLPRAPIS